MKIEGGNQFQYDFSELVFYAPGCPCIPFRKYNIPCLWCPLCNSCKSVQHCKMNIYIYMHKITNWFSKVSTKMQRLCKGAIELLKGWHHDFKAICSCKKEQKQRKVELHQRIQYLIFPKLKPLENCNWFWNRLIYNYWTEILPRTLVSKDKATTNPTIFLEQLCSSTLQNHCYATQSMAIQNFTKGCIVPF